MKNALTFLSACAISLASFNSFADYQEPIENIIYNKTSYEKLINDESNKIVVFVDNQVTLSVGIIYGGVNSKGQHRCGISVGSSLDGRTAQSDLIYSDTYDLNNLRTCLPMNQTVNVVSSYYRNYLKPKLKNPTYI